jgi:AcrR family transcriptional regulator
VAGLRQRRKDEKLTQIRAAALALFRRKGFHSVTTREVAEAADIGTGTLFTYARDKDELVLLAYGPVLAAAIATLIDSCPNGAALLDRLVHLYGGIIDIFTENPENLGAYLRAMQFAKHAGGHNQDAVERHHHLVSTVGEWIIDAQHSGSVDANVDPALASRNFHALFSAALAAALREPEPAASRAELHASFALQMRALIPTSTRKP